jgi:hypothetical protein
MQVILMEKVVNLGGLGDIVKVKDGYARNFLIPQGKAKRATEKNISDLAARRADLEKIAADKLAAQTALGEKLNGVPCKSPARRVLMAVCSVPSAMPISPMRWPPRASRSRSRPCACRSVR